MVFFLCYTIHGDNMSKKVRTSILLKQDNKYYVLTNIIFTKDNSIYCTFPGKYSKYIEKESVSEYINTDYIERERVLNELDLDNEQPKISFHPRDMIVHVNSNITKSISDDYHILNVADDSHLFCYLLQIIFPNNLDYYEEYQKDITEEYVIPYEPNNDSLNLEFIIHDSDIYANESCLPYSKNRRLFMYATCEIDYKYTYTVFCSRLNTITENVIININSKNKNCIYVMNIVK